MYRKSKKAALSQGGFLMERGCGGQRHWVIMHEPFDTASLACAKTTLRNQAVFFNVFTALSTSST